MDLARSPSAVARRLEQASTTSGGNGRGANVVASTQATRYDASQISRSVPRSWMSKAKPIRRSVISATPTPTGDLVAEPRRRSETRLQRRARHEDVERAQQRGAVAARDGGRDPPRHARSSGRRRRTRRCRPDRCRTTSRGGRRDGRAPRADIIQKVPRVIALTPASPAQPRQPKPDWLKVRAPGSPSYLRLKGLMRELNLHTVCEEARARTSASAGTTAPRRS